VASGWVVARAKTNQEQKAAEHVTNQLPLYGGGEFYYPKVLVKVRHMFCTKPLFGGYFFVRTVSGAWHFLGNTFGVQGVVRFGENVATIADEQIRNIRAREVDSIVVLPPPPVPELRWKRGTMLRVKGGVFSGNTGIYQGMGTRQREQLLMDFLGRKTVILLQSELLEAA